MAIVISPAMSRDTEAVRLIVINLDLEPSARGAKFRNQHITIEPVPAGSVDVHRAFADISLDNQDWGIDPRELCLETLAKFRGVIASAIFHEKEPVLGCVPLALLWNAVV